MESLELPPLAIIVVNFASHKLLQSNLTAVSRHTPNAKVIVVDSYSDEHERESVARLAEQQGWLTIMPPRNVGFGGGMNLGVALARQQGARCFLLLNPDAFLAADSLHSLWTAVREEPMTLLAPKILRPDGTIWFNGADLDLSDGATRASRNSPSAAPGRIVPWLSGACLMVSQQLWELVGGFDERYFLYWEDVDLSYRIQSAGARIRVLEGAPAVHDEGATHNNAGGRRSSLAKSNTYYYYNVRNRLLFAGLNLGIDAQRRWKFTAARAAQDILLRGGRRQFLRPFGALHAAISGTSDGFRLLKAAQKGR